jgi:tRNA nucleotidyltransferase (CCA-adding enzyme)
MSDYNFLMETRLAPQQYAVLTLMSRLAAELGVNLYLAGGAVRDLTYGQQVVRDLDFIVEGQPQRILNALPRADSVKVGSDVWGSTGEVPLGLEFQSFDEYFSASEMLFTNGVRAGLAMCREAFYVRPGQRPEIRPAMVFEDLKCRDFAINAMAVSLHPNSRGLLLDPTNGAGDIERHEIRALQSRGFFDDPSRIFRLLRLAMRLDFKPDERTQRWLDAALEDGAWERLDAEQQARELAAILHEDQPGRVLRMLSDRKILSGLDKKLATVHLPYDHFSRIRSVMQSAPGADPFLLNFHCLVEKLGGEHKLRLAKRIIGENKGMKLALSLDHDAKKLERVLTSAKASLPSHVFTLLSPQPTPVLFYLLANTKNAKVQNRIKSFLFKFPEVRAHLPRAELQSLGVKPGPEFDRIISKIFALQLDGKIKSHMQLMKEMRDLAGIKEPPPASISPKKGAASPGSSTVHARAKGRESASNSPSHKAKVAAAATSVTAPSAPGKAHANARGTESSTKPGRRSAHAPNPPVKVVSQSGRKER